MTARKSDGENKVMDPKVEADIKADVDAGPVIELEADVISDPQEEPVEKGDPSENSAKDVADSASDAQQGQDQDIALDSSHDEEQSRDAVELDQPSDETDNASIGKAPVSSADTATAKKGGMGSGLLGGLLGGVVALGLGYGGMQQGLIALPENQALQADRAAQLEGLTSALADLQGTMDAQSNAPQVDLSAFEDRLKLAESKLADLSSQFSQLNASVQSYVDIGNGATAASAENQTAQTSGSESGVSVIEGARDTSVNLTPLQDRLGALATDLAALSERVDGFKAVSDQLATTDGKVAALEEKAGQFVGLLESRLDEAKLSVLASADRRIDNVVTDVSNMRQSLEEDAKALTSRLSSLEDNNLSEKMQSSARTIALAGLENAVASGQSFAAALNTFAQVAQDNEAVKALKSYADAGAPTAQKLAQDFRGLSGQVLKAAEEAGTTGLVDKIMLNAQNLVRIRPIGEREGDSLTDKLARIEVRVSEGRLGEIAKEWEALPDAAKEAGKSWYEGVQARLAVDGSMQQIRSDFGTDAAQ
ncbi:MAG: hypothetical protein OIF56_04360 [Cohaesibacter sp.]|nr:hypothetical protein [Cohaesibacter sp.]MCV6601617.1 hypothetical protein [Cohaesibacter sp.]